MTKTELNPTKTKYRMTKPVLMSQRRGQKLNLFLFHDKCQSTFCEIKDRLFVTGQVWG